MINRRAQVSHTRSASLDQPRQLDHTCFTFRTNKTATSGMERGKCCVEGVGCLPRGDDNSVRPNTFFLHRFFSFILRTAVFIPASFPVCLFLFKRETMTLQKPLFTREESRKTNNGARGVKINRVNRKRPRRAVSLAASLFIMTVRRGGSLHLPQHWRFDIYNN